MKFNVRQHPITIGAAALVLANRAVAINADGLCRHAVADDVVIGISGPYDVAAGGNVDVSQSGVLPAVFESAVVAGDPVGLGADGQFKAVTAADALGVAAESVAAGELGSVRPKF